MFLAPSTSLGSFFLQKADLLRPQTRHLLRLWSRTPVATSDKTAVVSAIKTCKEDLVVELGEDQPALIKTARTSTAQAVRGTSQLATASNLEQPYRDASTKHKESSVEESSFSCSRICRDLVTKIWIGDGCHIYRTHIEKVKVLGLVWEYV